LATFASYAAGILGLAGLIFLTRGLAEGHHQGIGDLTDKPLKSHFLSTNFVCWSGTAPGNPDSTPVPEKEGAIEQGIKPVRP
jgi:hypothetical protein